MWGDSLFIPKYIVPPHPTPVKTSENPESALRTSWHPGYGENIFVAIPPFTWPNQVSNIFGVGRGAQIYKKWTINGGENWGWCWKIGKNTHLLADIRQDERPNYDFVLEGSMFLYLAHRSIFTNYYVIIMLSKRSAAIRRNFVPIILE